MNNFNRVSATVAETALATGMLFGVGLNTAHAETPSPTPSPTAVTEQSASPSATPESTVTPTPEPVTAEPVDDTCMLEYNYYHNPNCAGYIAPSKKSQSDKLPYTGDKTTEYALYGFGAILLGAAAVAAARKKHA